MTRRKVIYLLINITIYLVIGLLVFLLVFFLYNNGPNIVSASDGAFISSGILFTLSLFSFSFFNGYFDLFLYGFSVFPSMFSKDLIRKYDDLHDYKEIKEIKRRHKRKNYLAPLIAGTLYLIIAVILTIIAMNFR